MILLCAGNSAYVLPVWINFFTRVFLLRHTMGGPRNANKTPSTLLAVQVWRISQKTRSHSRHLLTYVA